MKNFILFTLLLFTLSAHAQNTFLDSSFGTNGIVLTVPPPGTNGGFSSVAIQPDHKIVAGWGTAMRYNENGTPDNTFATNGIHTLPGSSSLALVLQPDGKIVITGLPDLRLNIDGTIDSSFGHSGFDTLGGGAVALQPDGKIVLTGGDGTNIDIVRLLPNGKLDSAFGINGIVNTRIWSTLVPGWSRGIAVMPDGRIIVAGNDSPEFRLIAMRFLSNGQPDTSFNHTGLAAVTAGDTYNICAAMSLQSDGKVVVAGVGTFGAEGDNFTLIRYNTDGSLDRFFGDTGIANVDFAGSDDKVHALTIDAFGNLIAVGTTMVTGYDKFAMTRIDSNGHIDSSFGDNGRIITAIQNNTDHASGVSIQQDGKIILAGYSLDATGLIGYPVLARYLSFPPASVGQPNSKLSNPILFPNPASDQLTISNTDHIVAINACDALGNKISIHTSLPGKTILTYYMESGLYFFTISFNDRPPIIQKIIVQH